MFVMIMNIISDTNFSEYIYGMAGGYATNRSKMTKFVVICSNPNGDSVVLNPKPIITEREAQNA